MAIPCSDFRWAGRLMLLLAAVLVCETIATAIISDSLMIDLTPRLVFLFGQSVASGSRRAAKWSIGLMAISVVTSAIIFFVSYDAPERIQFNFRPASPSMVLWAQISAVVEGLWSAICIALLVSGLHATANRN